MLATRGGAPQDAQTVPVRIQVVDVKPFALDMVIPVFITGRDLTARIARDAGLPAFWEDNSRRLYWLRARGRVVQDNEKLSDFGLVPGELLHMLPQPPPNSGILEQPIDLPDDYGYRGGSIGGIAWNAVGMLAFTVIWGVGFTASQAILMGLFPPLAIGMMTSSLARHLMKGEPTKPLIPVIGVVLAFLLTVLGIAPAFALGVAPADGAWVAVPALVLAPVGAILGWLAWWGGAIGPIQKSEFALAAAVETSGVANIQTCASCGGQVDPSVLANCPSCSSPFHAGCFKSRVALTGTCPACNVKVA